MCLKLLSAFCHCWMGIWPVTIPQIFQGTWSEWYW